ncbi:hypothetical protein [Microbacterium sp. EST19A]|uniref:hypothetical protein n=1 Tax=Microbacterium sp. EST19A TaxID=2862681 RepID=UPI001CBE2C8A|nr:hypothetical protein [Microbacterium sp. EST19A]
MLGNLYDERLSTLHLDDFSRSVPDGAARAELRRRLGAILGFVAGTGEKVLRAFGEQHLVIGAPIVYFSSPRVAQVAMHVNRFSAHEAWAWATRYGATLDALGYTFDRIIVRRFEGAATDRFVRVWRRDLTRPLRPSIIGHLRRARGTTTVGVGKVANLAHDGDFSWTASCASNDEALSIVEELRSSDARSLVVIATLDDFDAIHGHGRDPSGFARALTRFDVQVRDFVSGLGEFETVIVTADHGNDPTAPGHGHSREYVPLLVFSGDRRIDLPAEGSSLTTVASLIGHLHGERTGQVTT